MQVDENDVIETENTENPVSHQECRAELRERFLWAVTALVGKEIDVQMHENISVSGVFRGVDKDVLSLHVQNLKTPTITYPHSMIRMPDCCSVKCNIKYG